ncbi:M20/M25/M40 family metallo-hydrolase [Gemmatimonadota bacterium]
MSVRKNLLVMVVSLCPILYGCEDEQYPEGRVEADVRFLADDLLEGRATPSEGLEVAALYLANQLRAAGVEPGVDGSYFQPYEVGVFDPTEAQYRISINGVPIPQSQYLFWSMGLRPEETPVEYDLVYAGHGIALPEEGVDDFRDLDVAGKGVVALRGAPWELDPHQFFAPDQGIGKAVQAAARNGAMMVYVSDEMSGGSPAETSPELMFISTMAGQSLTQLIEDPRTSAFSTPYLIIGPEVFNRALAGPAGGTYAELQASLAAGESAKGAIPATVRIEIDVETTNHSVSNVIGVLPGTDPVLRDEWVVLTAHFDHVGVYPMPPGVDGINNGADDNASGTAAVLEVARRLAGEDDLKRSVAFAFVSGEEKGLVGSHYYAAHPVSPLNQTVVNINVDMVGRSDGTAQGIAPANDDLFAKAVELGAEAGLTILPDQQPTWRLSYFTDSYHFAKHDIPAIFFFTALHEDYHQPSDEVEKVNFTGLGQVVNMLTELTEYYAEGAERPQHQRPAWFITPR